MFNIKNYISWQKHKMDYLHLGDISITNFNHKNFNYKKVNVHENLEGIQNNTNNDYFCVIVLKLFEFASAYFFQNF